MPKSTKKTPAVRAEMFTYAIERIKESNTVGQLRNRAKLRPKSAFLTGLRYAPVVERKHLLDKQLVRILNAPKTCKEVTRRLDGTPVVTLKQDSLLDVPLHATGTFTLRGMQFEYVDGKPVRIGV